MTDLKKALQATLSDGDLTRAEREDLRARLADPAQRALCQSLAFELAHEAIQNKTLPPYAALNWLEKIIKVLAPAPASAPIEKCEALFAPKHDCPARIIQLFDSARASADVCVFTITDDRISDALLRAHRRRVVVRIITDNDKAFDPGSDIDRFRAAGVPVRIDRTADHMHHKFALFDGGVLLTGSYNWTRSAAAMNEENLLITTEKRLTQPFRELFDRLWRDYA